MCFRIDDACGGSHRKTLQGSVVNAVASFAFGVDHANGNGSLHVAAEPTMNTGVSYMFCADAVKGLATIIGTGNMSMDTGVLCAFAQDSVRGSIAILSTAEIPTNIGVFVNECPGSWPGLLHCIHSLYSSGFSAALGPPTRRSPSRAAHLATWPAWRHLIGPKDVGGA